MRKTTIELLDPASQILYTLRTCVIYRLSLPDEIGGILSLQSLALTASSTLQTLPSWLGHMTGLTRLRISMAIAGGSVPLLPLVSKGP